MKMKVKQIAVVGVAVFLATGLITFVSNEKVHGESPGSWFTEENVGKHLVEAVFPVISRNVELEAVSELSGVPGQANLSEAYGLPEAEGSTQSETPELELVRTDSENPLVIIYHTHATEAYQPVPEGRYHSVNEAGSVREVGTILAEELEKLGIGVAHNKTLHDQPSYSRSYSRSLETAKDMMALYPEAVFVIDLHRDAAAYTGNTARTVLVNGETTARYSLVVGLGNENVKALRSYASRINNKAEEMYPGFGGRIIEKTYRYNQYISDYHILLEVGNNENNIMEARAAAKHFAHVLSEVIKDVTGER
jgi:stage II sporulation protein P